MSELLFECYNIPAICYGVDSLFSFHHNAMGGNGLILSCGYTTTHVIPVLNGTAIAENTRRINLGGYHMANYLHRLLQLKYPVHVNSITLSRIEEMLHGHCSIAVDYMDELKKWASIDYYERCVKKIQLQFTLAPSVQVLSAEQKFEKKKELARRLGEINARKREEKLIEDEILLQKLDSIRDYYDLDDECDEESFQFSLQDVGCSNYEDLVVILLHLSVE
jgi:actin-related protein 5